MRCSQSVLVLEAGCQPPTSLIPFCAHLLQQKRKQPQEERRSNECSRLTSNVYLSTGVILRAGGMIRPVLIPGTWYLYGAGRCHSQPVHNSPSLMTPVLGRRAVKNVATPLNRPDNSPSTSKTVYRYVRDWGPSKYPLDGSTRDSPRLRDFRRVTPFASLTLFTLAWSMGGFQDLPSSGCEGSEYCVPHLPYAPW